MRILQRALTTVFATCAALDNLSMQVLLRLRPLRSVHARNNKGNMSAMSLSTGNGGKDGIPPGFDQVLNNPATMEAAKKMMGDPEALKKLQEMMKDPATMQRVNAMMSDPSFRAKVDHLRKEANLPGADMPITDSMMEQAKRMMGFKADPVQTVTVNEVKNDDIDSALDATLKAKESVEALLKDSADPAQSSSSHEFASPVASAEGGLVELREYILHPHLMEEYLDLTKQAADVRKSLLPLRLFSTPDTGEVLNKASHFYFYPKGQLERRRARHGLGMSDAWKAYLKQARLCMQQQRSTLFVESPLSRSLMSGFKLLQPLRQEYNEDPLYEITRHKLRSGSAVIPKFLDFYARALPVRIAKGDESSELCSVMHTEVGEMNEVLEVWRHGNGVTALQKKNEWTASPEFKSAFAGISEISQSCETSLHRPLSFSNWK